MIKGVTIIIHPLRISAHLCFPERAITIFVQGVVEVCGERSSVGRAPDCDSGRRGFESHRSPHFPAGSIELNRIIRAELSGRQGKLRIITARVAELVDALDLGSSGVTRESSSLSFRTIFQPV